MNRLNGKNVIITGGASGIGKAAVIRFLEEGARVSAWDVNREAGALLLKELNEYKSNLDFRMVNVTSSVEVAEAMQQVVDKFGSVNIMINNAGITRDSTLLKMEESDFEKVIDVNLKGVFVCGQAAARIMVEQGTGGAIINTSSVVGLYGNFGQGNYVASKAGVIGLTKTWARELGRKGIRVNAVAPGFIETEMVKTVPDKVLTMLSEKTPLARLGRPADIANAYVFLASDEANYITGTVLSVDGGLIL
jgi:3-oxoacyl-[acyl-carrier protein] reductase